MTSDHLEDENIFPKVCKVNVPSIDPENYEGPMFPIRMSTEPQIYREVETEVVLYVLNTYAGPEAVELLYSNMVALQHLADHDEGCEWLNFEEIWMPMEPEPDTAPPPEVLLGADPEAETESVVQEEIVPNPEPEPEPEPEPDPDPQEMPDYIKTIALAGAATPDQLVSLMSNHYER
ncbi:MAG: hypothetical protein IJ523_12530, partial [Succinivibrionaceae bacterium]|nr:hypothetical protein [Succinivibrionaceae bacterium]